MNSDIIYLKMATELAKFSKCVSIQVSCLLVKNGRILSTGVNGTPKGWLNCSDKFPKGRTDEHAAWSSTYEIHAELNAIIWAARSGIAIEKATAYITHSPCEQCTKNLIASGIGKIIYAEKYHRTKNQEILNKFICENGIDIQHIPIQ